MSTDDIQALLEPWIHAIRERLGRDTIPDEAVQTATEVAADTLRKAIAMLNVMGTADPDERALVLEFAKGKLAHLAVALEREHTAEVRRRIMGQLFATLQQLLRSMQPSLLGVASGLFETALGELLPHGGSHG